MSNHPTQECSSGPGGPDDDSTNEFKIGQQFQNKEAVLMAVTMYNIKRAMEYKILENNNWNYSVHCTHFGMGCQWGIHVSYRRTCGKWEVNRYNGPHSCMQTSTRQDNRQLDSKVIAQTIFNMVREDPTIGIIVLQEYVENHFGHKASYRNVWIAKQIVIARLYGDWEESYNKLPRWLSAMQMYLPGTWVHLLTQPIYGDKKDVMFHQVFWTFPPCVEAFKNCMPVISIDETCLYGKYGGNLLMAIAQDGNSNIFPIAFAVVEGETKEAWSFFLTYLRQQVTPQPNILVIYDKHKTIDSALNANGSGWQEPNVFHAFCVQHIATNFMKHFKNNDLKKVLVNAAYSRSHREFTRYFNQLRAENQAITDWLDEMPRSHWTQYCDEGRRFGRMRTSISDCINGVMKAVRNLPITALVKSTYIRLGELFAKKGMEAHRQLQGGHQFSQFLIKAIKFISKFVKNMNVHQFDRSKSSFTVVELAETPGYREQMYRVLLHEGKCDCGYFQAFHIPCRHVLAACSHAQLDWKAYVHHVYRMDTISKVYKLEFAPIGHEDDWPASDGTQIRPNPQLMRDKKGRPIFTMI